VPSMERHFALVLDTYAELRRTRGSEKLTAR